MSIEALAVNADEWREELPLIEEWFEFVGEKLPTGIKDEFDALKHRLAEALSPDRARRAYRDPHLTPVKFGRRRVGPCRFANTPKRTPTGRRHPAPVG